MGNQRDEKIYAQTRENFDNFVSELVCTEKEIDAFRNEVDEKCKAYESRRRIRIETLQIALKSGEDLPHMLQSHVFELLKLDLKVRFMARVHAAITHTDVTSFEAMKNHILRIGDELSKNASNIRLGTVNIEELSFNVVHCETVHHFLKSDLSYLLSLIFRYTQKQ